MSRPIKFRGKRKDNGEWVYGYYRYDSYYDLHQICYIREMPELETGHIWENPVVIPETVGQFVCKDKNGKEVFAGDETNHGIIVWDIEMFQWHLLENITDILGDKQKIGQEYLLCEYADDIELIEEKNNG